MERSYDFEAIKIGGLINASPYLYVERLKTARLTAGVIWANKILNPVNTTKRRKLFFFCDVYINYSFCVLYILAMRVNVILC